LSNKIKLNKDILKKDGAYQVYVSGKFYEFSSYRKAEDFIRAVDIYLNAQFEMVNANLITVYGTYRRLSWYVHSYDRTSLRLQINEIEQSIELSIERADWSSWRNTIFSKLDYSISLLDTVLKRMQEIATEKKYTVLSGEIKSNLRAVELLKMEVERFDIKNNKYLAEEKKGFTVYRKISNQ